MLKFVGRNEQLDPRSRGIALAVGLPTTILERMARGKRVRSRIKQGKVIVNDVIIYSRYSSAIAESNAAYDKTHLPALLEKLIRWFDFVLADHELLLFHAISQLLIRGQLKYLGRWIGVLLWINSSDKDTLFRVIRKFQIIIWRWKIGTYMRWFVMSMVCENNRITRRNRNEINIDIVKEQGSWESADFE